MKPFIYIASLHRTGSKVLSEALSLAPHSFVFREPGLVRGKFKVKPKDIEIFKHYGIDLLSLQNSMPAITKRSDIRIAVKYFKKELLPELLQAFPQIGIKEIHHKYWKILHEVFPDMKVILTGRDPRDIYLSHYYNTMKRRKRGKRQIKTGGVFTPQNIVHDIRKDFVLQQEMYSTINCLKIKYEDFCTNTQLLGTIKSFVESDIPDIGIIGQLSVKDHFVHGYTVTDKRVHRWKSEQNKRLLENAQTVFDRLEDYCTFWGYEK